MIVAGATPPPPLAGQAPPAPQPALAQAIANINKRLEAGGSDPSLALPPAPSSSLAPGRTPAPNAVVVGSSLRIGERLTKPQTQGVSVPPAPASVPSTVPSVPPSAPKVGPSGATLPSAPPKAVASAAPAPAGASPYDKAFRRWSQPPNEEVEPLPTSGAPVTFQVYTAKDISAGRGPMRSMAAIPPAAPKMSLGARIGMAVFGLVVVLTVAAVIAVSTEDPKPPTPAAQAHETPIPDPATAPTAPTAPTPSTIAIGDPPDDEPSTLLVAVPPPVTTAALPSAHPVVRPRPKPTSSAKPVAGSPPPNPYAN